MAFQVHVRDFQSIGDVTIEVDGLTVITGPNNSGKTALIRAIFGAFTNARGTAFVRFGRETTRVEIRFSDGRSLAWEKGAKVNRYELDGKALNRVGTGAPAEVAGLGVLPIEAAGRELWPQFAHQFVGQVFLLNEPGSVLAEAIANVDKVGVLNEALRLSQSDRRSAASDLKLRLEDVAKAESALARYEGLDEVVERVRRLETRREEIRRNEKTLSYLSGTREKLGASRKAVATLVPIRAITVANEETITRAKKTSAALEWARGAASRLEKATKEREVRAKAVASASGTTIPDPQRLLEARARLETARALSEKWRLARGAVESLTAKVGTLRRDHSVSESEVKSLFSESGSCPFCGVTHESDDSC